MSAIGVQTDEAEAILLDLMGRDYVSMTDFERIGRLAKIVGRRTGRSRDEVLADVALAAA